MTKVERRHVCRVIDLAVAHCEEANLLERRQVPRWIADLLVAAGKPGGKR